ncbi:acyltransferase [Pseudarthrobacter sp. AB1]|uniref:acyltransferase family protein n=1 Tax=Pseudarthrobacter sp. AB1 TaxID=2138309 RepID=UPI00186BA621|nr:acyltransferase [Pseudarthrobacter sp. AB1]
MGAAPSWGQRLIGIDGLRGLAAVMVIITHTNQRLSPDAGPSWLGSAVNFGGQGLTLFFALSGFLLYRPFVGAIVSGSGFPSLRNYFTNRALRIFPAYVAIFLFVALIAGVAYLRPAALGEISVVADQPVGYLTDPFLLISNGLMLQTLTPGAIKTGIPAAWSLTVELAFYAVMPLLALIAIKVNSRRRSAAVWWASMPIVAMLVIGAIGKYSYGLIANPANRAEAYWLEWGGNWTAVLGRSFLYHADLFAWGMVAALILSLYQRGTLSARTLHLWRCGALALGVMAAIAGWLFEYSNSGFAVLSGAVILFVATPTRLHGAGRLATTLQMRPFERAGQISYSAYLWHIPVILLIQRYSLALPDTVAGWIGNTMLVLALTAALSTLTYKFIEQPPLALKKRTGPTQFDPRKVDAQGHKTT